MIDEVDYNHPDHPDHPDQQLKKMLDEIRTATSIEVEDSGALVIYVPNDEHYPPAKWAAHMRGVREKFIEIFPDTHVVATSYRMEFTTITKKRTFSEKLAGNI